MEDQINRLRALEAASSSPKGGNNGALSTGGFHSLDVSGVSARQPPAGGAQAAQQASQRAASSPGGGAGGGGGALSRPTTTVTDLRKEPFPGGGGDVTRMEVAAEVGSEKMKSPRGTPWTGFSFNRLLFILNRFKTQQY